VSEDNSYFTVESEEDNILVVTMRAPGDGPNTMGSAFGAGIEALLPRLEEKSVKGLVMLSGHADFMVGADLKEMSAITSDAELDQAHRRMSETLARIEKLPYPTVAGITGQTLGGGFELALTFKYRLMSDDPQAVFAFPEVTLGLIPGAGGTQRLPRLAGLKESLDFILSGKRMFPKRALKLGVADRTAPKNILRFACIKLVRDVIAGKYRRKSLPVSDALWRNFGTGILRSFAEKDISKRTKGLYPAPKAALDAMLTGIGQSLTAGLETEKRRFIPLVGCPVSKALRHLFACTVALKKKNGIDGTPGEPKQVKNLGVLGAGFMGAGIAAVALEKGTRVRLKDLTAERTAPGVAAIQAHFASKARKRIIENHMVDIHMGHLTAGPDDRLLDGCDLIIEAIDERLQLKRDVLKSLQDRNRVDAIIASNTSALPIDQIADGLSNPSRLVGMHFFSPVEKMPLIEVIVPPRADPDAVATVVAYGRKMGKTVIMVRDGPGFYTTRVIGALMNEAIHMLFEGASVEAVDRAFTQGGFPVGAFQLLDEVGLDVAFKVNKTLAEAFGNRLKGPEGWESLIDADRRGRKSGRGFYRYEGGKRQGVDESFVRKLPRKNHGGDFSPKDVQERALFSFIHESILCLEEGILPSSVEGDIGAVMGIGFPPHLGGPFFHMDTLGLEETKRRLEALGSRFPDRFTVPKLLTEKLASGSRFGEDLEP